MWAKRTIVGGLGYARRVARAIVIIATLAIAGEAHAAKCNVRVAAGLAFGVYDPFSAADTTTFTSILYQCAASVTPRIELSRGNSATYERELRQGEAVLRYDLCLDAQCEMIWGDGTDGTSVGPYLPEPAGRNEQRVYVFGVIPAGQDPLAGAYSDAVVVTIQF